MSRQLCACDATKLPVWCKKKDVDGNIAQSIGEVPLVPVLQQPKRILVPIGQQLHPWDLHPADDSAPSWLIAAQKPINFTVCYSPAEPKLVVLCGLCDLSYERVACQAKSQEQTRNRRPFLGVHWELLGHVWLELTRSRIPLLSGGRQACVAYCAIPGFHILARRRQVCLVVTSRRTRYVLVTSQYSLQFGQYLRSAPCLGLDLHAVCLESAQSCRCGSIDRSRRSWASPRKMLSSRTGTNGPWACRASDATKKKIQDFGADAVKSGGLSGAATG